MEKTAATRIKSLLQTPSSTIVSNDIYDVVVLDDINAFIDRHISNLKPLVFFNSVKTLDLLHRIVTAPRLTHLDEVADLRDHTCASILVQGLRSTAGGYSFRDAGQELLSYPLNTCLKVLGL